MTIALRCVSEPFPGDYAYAVIADKDNTYLMMAILKKYSELQ